MQTQTELRRTLFPPLVGLLLGLMQTGLFLQLTFTLSSSIGTSLLVTLCWLVGSAVGALWVSRTRLSLAAALALGLVAYGLCAALLAAAPFQTTWYPLYGALILCIGVYPGMFFARLSSVYTARALLLMENNGFIVGLVAGTVLFMLVGRAALWVGPVVVALALWGLGQPTPMANEA